MTQVNDVNAETSVFEAAPGPQQDPNDEEFPSWVAHAQQEGNTTLRQLLSHREIDAGEQNQETLGDVLGLPSVIQTEDNLETLLSGTFLFTAESLAHLRSAQPAQPAAPAPTPDDAAPVAPTGNGASQPPTASPPPAAAPRNKRPAEGAPPSEPQKTSKLRVAASPGITLAPTEAPVIECAANVEEKLELMKKRDAVQTQELKLLRAALKHLYKKYQTMKSKYNEMKGVLRSHQAAQQQAMAAVAAQQNTQQQQQAQAATFPTPFNQAPAAAQMQQPMAGQGMQYMSPYSPHSVAASAGNSAMANAYMNASTPSGGLPYQAQASPGSFSGALRPAYASSVQQQLAAYGASGVQPTYQQQQQPGQQGQTPLYTTSNVPTITFAGGPGFPSQQQQQRR